MNMKIRDVYEAGSSPDGQTIRLNVTKEDGSRERLELDHTDAGKLMGAVAFAAGVGKSLRQPIVDMLGSGIELSRLIDPEFFSVTSAPGLDFFVLRLALAPETFLDFRISLTQAAPMKAEIDRAALLARSSDRPAGVH